MADVDEMDRGKSPQQLAMEAEEMADEESDFASYTRLWNSHWGADGCGSFPDMTTVSSMHFTHAMPGGSHPSSRECRVAPTLQIFSVKVSEIKGGLRWPLPVYGVVAARDAVDHNRNLLFARDRSACQMLTEDDPFLRLVGPSRAVVFEDPVALEMQLRVRGGGAASGDDRALITATRSYSAGGGTICFSNCFCTTELKLEVIERTVQATILGVRLKQACAWPFRHGGRVVCFAPSQSLEVVDGEVTHVTDPEPTEVVLLDSRRRPMLPPTGLYDGCLSLSRHVVSVEIQGSLDVVLQAYSSSGDVTAQGQVRFTAQQCQTSHGTCNLGDAELEVTVAWSRLVFEKQDIASQGWVLEE